jgi:hypothetical protein
VDGCLDPDIGRRRWVRRQRDQADGHAGWIGGGDRFDLTPSGAFDSPANVFSIPANRARC